MMIDKEHFPVLTNLMEPINQTIKDDNFRRTISRKHIII
jgi:hypothetical protein